MSHDHHAEPFPRAMLLLAGGLIATTLLLTTAVRLGWVAQSADPVALRAAAQTKALASRDLRFLDAPGGGVQILDAKTGAVAGSVQAGSTNGFIRGVMRGLARERRLAGKSPETPFRLTAWANGELSLTDLATGRVIEVGSFGATNRNAFAALLPGIAPLPTPPSPHERSGATTIMIAAFWPALPIVMLGWFVGTGAILWLDRRPRSTHGGSLLALTFLAGFATFAVLWSTAVTDGAGAIVAFLAALTLWGWHETAFLMGFVTGPNRGHAAPDLRGFARFRAAAATLIHHELALAATLVALYAVSWNAANMLAAHSFALLFALRLSSKLNIHLGVANLSAEMLPDHLAYLGSYFRRRAMNPLFPLSIMGCAALVWHFATAALALPPGSGGQTAAAILATLSALGLIEHLFLMLPIKDSALWRWAMPRSARSKT